MDSNYAIGSATAGRDRPLDDARGRASFTVPILFFLTTMVVLAANSNQPALVAASANLRFVMYASLIVAALGIRRRHDRLPIALVFALAALAALALSSVTWTVTPRISLLRAIGFSLLLTSAALVSARTWPDFPAVRRCFTGMVLGVTVVLLTGLAIVVVGWPNAYDPSSLRRFMGLLVNPNSVGVVVGLFLPISLGMRRSASGGPSRWAYDFALVILVVSLVLSQSRGGAAAAAVGLIVYVLVDRSLDRAKALVAGSAILLAGVAFLIVVPQVQPEVVADLQQRFTASQPNSQRGSGRTVAWALAVDIWEARPVAGWGFGSAEAVFGDRSVEIEQVFQGHNPHNSYFNALLELGPGGVVLLMAAVALPAARSISRRREPFVAGLSGAVCAGVTISVFESGLTSPGSFLGFTFWIIAIGLIRITESE